LYQASFSLGWSQRKPLNEQDIYFLQHALVHPLPQNANIPTTNSDYDNHCFSGSFSIGAAEFVPVGAWPLSRSSWCLHLNLAAIFYSQLGARFSKFKA
jgi:hypothetical protein